MQTAGPARRASSRQKTLIALLVCVGIACDAPSSTDAPAKTSPESVDAKLDHVLDLSRAARFARATRDAAGRGPVIGARHIALPADTSIAWAVKLPTRAALRFESVRIPNGRTADIQIEFDGVETIESLPLEACSRACIVDISGHSGRVVALSLHTVATGAVAGSEAVLFNKPELVGDIPVPATSAGPPDRRPDVIIYLIDTLRPDHLGTYGYDKPTSPHIDEFTEGATLFETALAQAPWTKTSVASLFTGLRGRTHGILTMNSVMPESTHTLAERLEDAGYRTAAVVTNGLVDADFGFDQGFEYFKRERGRAPDVPGLAGFQSDKPAIDSDIAQATALEWLETSEDPRPLFLYLHTLDPHTPHFPPEPFKTRFVPDLDAFDLGSMESARALSKQSDEGNPPDTRIRTQFVSLYDAEIAHNDHQFGRFIESLESMGLYDDALIVLISDHGEAFWEHGRRGHGNTLHEVLLRIPLVIKVPGQSEGRRTSVIAQQVDILPTIADYAGLDLAGTNLHGRSLRGAIERGSIAGPEPLIVATGSPGTSIREGRFKLIRPKASRRPLELYDLETDPEERQNVAKMYPIMARYLLESLARAEAGTTGAVASEEVQLTPEKRAELRALGYVE